MKRLTAQWVRKAEPDYRAAAKLARGSVPQHDEVCFHFQQSVEKYLKALLEELGKATPRTHVLEDLVQLQIADHPGLGSLRRGMRFLIRFAVRTRYPGQNATRRQANAARCWASRLRDTARALLGLQARRRRGRKGP